MMEALFDKQKLISLLLNFFERIPKETIQQYVEQKKELVPLISEKLKSFALWVIKRILRIYWQDIEYYLTNPDKLLELLLEKRPDLRDIFEKPENRKWFEDQCWKLYDWLYDFTWKD